MTAPQNFKSFVGNRRVVDILRRAVDQGRLPHALIFAGPSGVGKRTLALLLAQLLNCIRPERDEPCGVCNACRKISGGTHPDVRVVEPDGAFIKIDQVRAMIDEVAYQPFEGKYRMVILDGADQMRVEAANCLLKTLEEPPSRSVLVLVTAKPYLLLGTIRSRSRLLQFGPIAEDDIEAFLTGTQGRTPDDARLAASFSNGSLSMATAFDAARHKEVRAMALRFVSMLLRREGFAQASALGSGIAKDKELFLVWLDMAATLLQDVYYAQTAPARIGQRDIARELAGLAQSAPRARVLGAIEAVKNLRSGLLQNVNRQLALEALFLAETARS